jgi:NodT family efflux transporter outer membrane factor (OMF) lipoprotein
MHEISMKNLIILLPLFVAACSAAPTYSVPATKGLVSEKSFRGAVEEGKRFNYDWWKRFNDPLLNELIDAAAKSNLDIQVAVLKVEEARAGSTATGSRLMPSVNLESTASDTRSGLPAAFKLASPDTRAYRVDLNASWEIDLFGAARASLTASDFEAKAASYGIDAVSLMVTSEVARQYFIWQGARTRMKLIQDILDTQKETERLTGSRLKNGQSSKFDFSRASSETRKIASQIPELETLISTTENRIAVLLNESPIKVLPLLQQAKEPQLADVPIMASGQPVELLERRPDLKVAEMKFEAEQARLKEKRANQLPKFYLSALFGREGLTINSIPLSPVMYSNVALAFAMPVFNAGRLQAEVDGQSAREKAASLNYEKSVLTAVEDVEDSLVALNKKKEQLSEQIEASKQLNMSLHHAKSLYREGQIDLLQLLDVQRGVLAEDMAVTESKTQVLINAVQLFKAMGGGWEVEKTSKPPDSSVTGMTKADKSKS